MTDKFDPGSNVVAPTTNRQSNNIAPGVALRDSSGRLLTNIELDQYGRGSYTRTIGEGDLGVNTWNSNFTGKPGTSGSFTQHIYDANGNLQGSQVKTVDQVVAGPGIYISSPNGQGVVTVSTSPLPTSVNKQTLFDVYWTKPTGTASPGTVGHFTAVGNGGANLRSRDGYNWAQMTGIEQTILGVSSEINDNIPDGHIEMNGVGPGGTSIYGRVGLNGDAMIIRSQLSDQNGLITERLISTFIFGTGATTPPGPTTSTIFTVQTYAFRNNTSYVETDQLLWTGGYEATSEVLAVNVTPNAAWTGTFAWSIALNNVEIGYGITESGTTNLFSASAQDTPMPPTPGILYGYGTGNMVTFTQGADIPLVVTIFNDGLILSQTSTTVKWS